MWDFTGTLSQRRGESTLDSRHDGGFLDLPLNEQTRGSPPGCLESEPIPGTTSGHWVKVGESRAQFLVIPDGYLYLREGREDSWTSFGVDTQVIYCQGSRRLRLRMAVGWSTGWLVLRLSSNQVDSSFLLGADDLGDQCPCNKTWCDTRVVVSVLSRDWSKLEIGVHLDSRIPRLSSSKNGRR